VTPLTASDPRPGLRRSDTSQAEAGHQHEHGQERCRVHARLHQMPAGDPRRQGCRTPAGGRTRPPALHCKSHQNLCQPPHRDPSSPSSAAGPTPSNAIRAGIRTGNRGRTEPDHQMAAGALPYAWPPSPSPQIIARPPHRGDRQSPGACPTVMTRRCQRALPRPEPASGQQPDRSAIAAGRPVALALIRITSAHAVFTARPEGPRLPGATACLAVAISHSPAIDDASVASSAALPVTRAITPTTSASAPMAETSTT
jgi:hypothetical protein